MTDEVRALVAIVTSFIFGGGAWAVGARFITDFLAKRARVGLETREAKAEDTKTEARKDNLLMDQIEELTQRIVVVEAKQAKTEAERDAAIEESRAYKIALEQSNDRYERYQQETNTRLEGLQGEVKELKSENQSLRGTVDKLQSDVINFEEKLNTETGEKKKLAAELAEAKNTIQSMEKINQEREIQRAAMQGQIDVFEKILGKVNITPSESAETKPEPQESSEIHTQENQ